jgi:hypothetical protein
VVNPIPRPFNPGRQPIPRGDELDGLLSSLVGLRSKDPERIRSVLSANHPLPAELIPAVVGLLADERVEQKVLQALGHVAPEHTGALLDSVLNPRHPLSVRLGICGLFGSLPTQRCASGLVLLLSNSEPDIRYTAATNLLAICIKNSDIEIPKEIVFDAATAESFLCRQLWNRHRASHTSSDVAAIDSAKGRRVLQGIGNISTLLMIVLDRNPLQLALRAVMSGQGHSRGTGLEYLESVLPPSLLMDFRSLLVDDMLTWADANAPRSILASGLSDSGLSEFDLTRLRAHVDAFRQRSPIREPGQGKTLE